MVIVIHGILSSPVIQRINKTEYLKEVVVSDSLPQNKNKRNVQNLKHFQ